MKNIITVLKKNPAIFTDEENKIFEEYFKMIGGRNNVQRIDYGSKWLWLKVTIPFLIFWILVLYIAFKTTS